MKPLKDVLATQDWVVGKGQSVDYWRATVDGMSVVSVCSCLNNLTIVTIIVDKKLLFTGVARCNPVDTFNKDVGWRIAMRRAVDSANDWYSCNSMDLRKVYAEFRTWQYIKNRNKK